MATRAKFVVAAAALVAVVLLVSTQVLSQDKPAQEGAQDPMAEMMAKWKALNAKGPEHEEFKQMVGTWDAESKMWFTPDGEPQVGTGTAEYSLLLDGRYVQQKYTCAEFKGLGIDGFDRTKNKYVSVWMDDASTGIYICEGTVDETGKVVTYYGKMDDPMTGEKDKVVKSVVRKLSKDKVVFEMYEKGPDGKEFKNMELTYTRRK